MMISGGHRVILIPMHYCPSIILSEHNLEYHVKDLAKCMKHRQNLHNDVGDHTVMLPVGNVRHFLSLE